VCGRYHLIIFRVHDASTERRCTPAFLIHPDGLTPVAGVLPSTSTECTMNRDRIFRFGMMIWQTYGLSKEELLRIVRSKNRYSTRYRAAALRHLVAQAPVSVTCGRPFAARRRLVRQYYGI